MGVLLAAQGGKTQDLTLGPALNADGDPINTVDGAGGIQLAPADEGLGAPFIMADREFGGGKDNLRCPGRRNRDLVRSQRVFAYRLA
jgi:hypothetical protein